MNIGTLTIEMAANVARLQTDMNQAKSVVSDSMKSIEEAVGFAKKAFIAMTGVASVDAFKNIVLGAIEATANLNKLAIQSGMTVENLSALAAVGKATGTSAETIAAASNKFSKALASQNEDSKGAAAALRSLGLSFNDLQTMEPDKRMKLVADAMGNFADGGQKTAAAMMLFGRSGAELLPMLKDLAAAGELNAKVTNEQGLQAQEFQKNMAQMKANGEAWRKSLAMELLPTLNDIVKIMLLLKDSTKDVGVALGEGLKVVLQTVVVLAVNTVYVLKQIYKEASGIISQFSALGEAGGVFTSAGRAAWTAAGKKMEEDAKAAREDVDRLSNLILGKGDAGRGRFNPADPRLIGNQPKPKLTGLNGDPTGGTATPENQGLSYLNSLKTKYEGLIGTTSEYEQALRRLAAIKNPVDAAMRRQIEDLAKLIDLTVRQNAMRKADEDEYQRTQADLTAAEVAESKAREQARQAVADYAQAVDDSNAAMQFELTLAGKSASQRQLKLDQYRAELDLKRQLDAIDRAAGLDETQRIELRNKARAAAAAATGGLANAQDARDARLRDPLAGMRDALAEYQDMIGNVANSTKAMMTNAFKGMEDALVNFVKTGKLDFSSLADSVISDMIRIQIQQRITGPLSAALGSGDLFGGLSSLLGFANGGQPPVGVPSLVGERGPELFVPSVPGTIVPNQALGAALQNPQPAQTINVTQNFTVGDVASSSLVRQSVQDSERRLVAALSRQSRYGGVLA